MVLRGGEERVFTRALLEFENQLGNCMVGKLMNCYGSAAMGVLPRGWTVVQVVVILGQNGRVITMRTRVTIIGSTGQRGRARGMTLSRKTNVLVYLKQSVVPR